MALKSRQLIGMAYRVPYMYYQILQSYTTLSSRVANGLAVWSLVKQSWTGGHNYDPQLVNVKYCAQGSEHP